MQWPKTVDNSSSRHFVCAPVGGSVEVHCDRFVVVQCQQLHLSPVTEPDVHGLLSLVASQRRCVQGWHEHLLLVFLDQAEYEIRQCLVAGSALATELLLSVRLEKNLDGVIKGLLPILDALLGKLPPLGQIDGPGQHVATEMVDRNRDRSRLDVLRHCGRIVPGARVTQGGNAGIGRQRRGMDRQRRGSS